MVIAAEFHDRVVVSKVDFDRDHRAPPVRGRRCIRELEGPVVARINEFR